MKNETCRCYNLNLFFAYYMQVEKGDNEKSNVNYACFTAVMQPWRVRCLVCFAKYIISFYYSRIMDKKCTSIFKNADLNISQVPIPASYSNIFWEMVIDQRRKVIWNNASKTVIRIKRTVTFWTFSVIFVNDTNQTQTRLKFQD